MICVWNTLTYTHHIIKIHTEKCGFGVFGKTSGGGIKKGRGMFLMMVVF